MAVHHLICAFFISYIFSNVNSYEKIRAETSHTPSSWTVNFESNINFFLWNINQKMPCTKWLPVVQTSLCWKIYWHNVWLSEIVAMSPTQPLRQFTFFHSGLFQLSVSPNRFQLASVLFVIIIYFLFKCHENHSLWPSDAIWQHRPRLTLVLSAITQTDVDLSSKMFCGIHLRATSQEVLMTSICNMNLEITLLNYYQISQWQMSLVGLDPKSFIIMCIAP